MFFSNDRIWRYAEGDYSRYEAPFHDPTDWVLVMRINTKNIDGMFNLLVFGEEPKELVFDPVLILGQPMIGFQDCVFYTRIPSEDVKFYENKFYSQWFDLESELINKTIMCKNKLSNAEVQFTPERQIAFHEKMGQEISFRFELGFEENGKPVIKVRAVNMRSKAMTAQWLRGNVPSVHVTSLEVKALEMEPPVETLGFKLPFYPVLFTPMPISMTIYDNYVTRVMPGILSQVLSHRDFTPQEWQTALKDKTLYKNTSR